MKYTKEMVQKEMKEDGYRITGPTTAEYHNCGYYAVYAGIDYESTVNRCNEALAEGVSENEMIEVIQDWLSEWMVSSRG